MPANDLMQEELQRTFGKNANYYPGVPAPGASTAGNPSGQPAPLPNVPSGGAGAGGSSGGDPTYGGRVYTGFTPKQNFGGFDFTREQNTGKSAKDAFADLANTAPPAPLTDKAALAAWFKQYVEPGMNALGHKVSAVEGDKFRYANHEGDFWVDYGVNAGAPNSNLAWQAEPGDDATRARYGSPASSGGALPPVPGGSRGAPAIPGQQSDLMELILEALAEQQQPDPQSLLQQFLI